MNVIYRRSDSFESLKRVVRLHDLFMSKPSSFAGEDQTAADPITVCTFTACQFNNTRVLYLSHMLSFPMGAVPEERSLSLFLLLASWLKLISHFPLNKATNQTTVIVRVLYSAWFETFAEIYWKHFMSQVREERGRRWMMAVWVWDLDTWKTAVFPTIHFWKAKLWFWFVVGMFASSNLSPMQSFGDESSAPCLPKFSQPACMQAYINNFVLFFNCILSFYSVK